MSNIIAFPESDATPAHGLPRPVDPLDTTPTTPVGRFIPAPTAEKPAATRYVAAAGRWAVGLTLWAAQYGFAVWAILAWRTTKACFKAVGFAGALIFLPIVGWLILWAIMRGRKRDRQYDELLQAVNGDTRRSIFAPWALGWVKGS